MSRKRIPATPTATLFVVACAMLGAEPSFRNGDLVALVAEEEQRALVLERGAVARVDEPEPRIELESQAQLDRFFRLGALRPATDADHDGIADEEPDPHRQVDDFPQE